MNLRPYQIEACDAVMRELEQHRSTLLVLPTGAGKTICFAEIAGRFLARGGRTLIIAHREELLQQAIDKIRDWLELKPDEIGIERAEESCAGGLLPPKVVVASVQTLSREKRLLQYPSSSFALVVIDEAHHAVSQSYRDVLDHFGGARVLGVTATPDRLDGKGMGAIFESSAYVYEIRTAIEQGYLCPIRQKAVHLDDLDLSAVRTTAGDLNEGDLDALMREERHLHEVARPTVDLAGDRKTLIFGVTVQHAKDLAQVINGYFGGRMVADSVDGGMDRDARAKVLANFSAGRIQFLANCMIATEGFDLPAIACVAMARPTKSRALYAQMLGRGTRIAPGKADLLVLDFAGNAGKHSLVNALDVLDGDLTLERRERAKRILAARPDLDVLAAVDLAEEQLRTEQRARVRAQARFRAVDVDPFGVVGLRRERFDGAPPATEAQRTLLDRLGVTVPVNRHEASALIDSLLARRKKGLCSFKQAKLLARYGLDTEVGFDVASKQIDRIAQNGWRLPEELEGLERSA